eukprot:TRINITY_DN66017_c9_g6_i1.p2 TRINITY_DN66017_c9_g6~~TRINITY_DN66017_c9_g6_i1.p2  ORF type:complete len:141 (+),score=93.18 TRINITY_DN66017_c9_g6_i1:80-502(+)
MGFIKTGKVVIVLAGRFAGKKAIVVKVYNDGTRERQFSHCLVAGIDSYPLKVTKSMGKKKIEKRSRIKPFVQYVNFNHIMPTRYSVDISVKDAVTPSAMKKLDSRKEARKQIKQIFEKRYLHDREKNSNGVQFFFRKLRF